MILTVLLLLLLLIVVVEGSSGDRDYQYSYCLQQCHDHCSSSGNSINGHKEKYREAYHDIHYYHITSTSTTTTATNTISSIDIYSNIFNWPIWSCIDMCKYMCMHTITKNRIQLGYPIHKYYGHWPFIRYMGLEEPASVLFSMLNALPHVLFLTFTLSKSNISNIIPSLSLSSYPSHYYMRPWLVLSSILALLSWTSAIIFHSQKTALTSLIDYITAFIFIFYSFWIAIRRVWGGHANYYNVLLSFIVLLVLCSYRVVMMMIGDVTFDNHMRLSIGLAVASVVIWVIWIFVITKVEHNSYRRVSSSSPPPSSSSSYHRKWLCLWCQALFCFASLLEIFDFPPYYGIFDAHSLWHASTVPIAFLWYHFWYRDSLEYIDHDDDDDNNNLHNQRKYK